MGQHDHLLLHQHRQSPVHLHPHNLAAAAAPHQQQQQQQQQHAAPAGEPALAPQASTSTAPPPDSQPGLEDEASALSQSQLKKQPAKLFRCTGFGDCQMTFTRSEHLARHVRKHTGERPFKCHCGREFSRLDNVRQHAATVHSEQTDRNAQTIADLVALHNQLSLSTQQRQKDAGMVLQDSPGPEKGPRRRAETEAKPKKLSAKKKQTAADKKAREQAEAAELVAERQRAADQEAAVAAAQQRTQNEPSPANSAQAQPQPQQSPLPMQSQGGLYGSPYGGVGARPPYSAAGPGGAYPAYGPHFSTAAAPSFGGYPQNAYIQYTSQLAAHQQLYAAGMAPPPPPPPNTMPYLPPGMDVYAAAAAGYAPSHGYLPQPPPPSQAQSGPAPADASSARYNAPGPLACPPVSGPQQTDAGQLTPNKISLPSISALLPSPFASEQQTPQQAPQAQQVAQQRGSHGTGDAHVASQQQQQQQQQQQPAQRQQAYYAALSAAQGRPPPQMSVSTASSSSPHLQHVGIQQPYGGTYTASGAGELQYPPHSQQVMPGQHAYDPYARPSSTAGSERDCPPSLSNGSSSTTSSFQAGSPQHPHIVPQHYSHLYHPTAPPQQAYHYAPPPAQPPLAYSYASGQYFTAPQQPFTMSGAAHNLYGQKYAMHQPQQPYAPLPSALDAQSGRESLERGV